MKTLPILPILRAARRDTSLYLFVVRLLNVKTPTDSEVRRQVRPLLLLWDNLLAGAAGVCLWVHDRCVDLRPETITCDSCGQTELDRFAWYSGEYGEIAYCERCAPRT